MKSSMCALFAAVVLACGAPAARAETWVPTSGNNFYTIAGNWSPASVPNAVGASAQFNATTGVDSVIIGSAVTVGSLSFNMTGSTSNNDHQLQNDTILPNGTLTFDNGGAGATITTTGTANLADPTEANIDFLLNLPVVFADNVTAVINQTRTTTTAGSLSIAAPVSGPGGFTKQGPGIATFIDGAKTYTGPTLIQEGKMRLRTSTANPLGGLPSGTSSFRILDGATVEPSFSGDISFGTGSLFLNGDGSSVIDAFGGALRADRIGNAATGSGRIYNVLNPVVLESDATIHVQTQNDTTMGSITLSNVVSGPGRLELTSVIHNEQLGSYILTNDNTYTGGTLLRGGTLRLSTMDANLGTGNVRVLSGRYLEDGVTEIHSAAISRLLIETGVADGIADNATLTLGGQFNTSAAKAGFAELQAGVSETVAGLVLGTTAQLVSGTYGSTSSTAMFQSAALDEFFTGPGVINLVLPAMDDADFDGDGDVDGADFLTWQRGLGQSGAGATKAAGNANSDMVIDGADLAVWRAQFAVPAVPAVGPVPEPGAVLLALLAGPLGLLARRKRVA